MEQQSPAPASVLDSKKQKEIALKNRIKAHRKKEQEKNASSSSSTGIRCSECSMSFLSVKAMFGHLRIHRKEKRGAQKTSLLQLRQAKLSNDFIAACILMGIRRSKLETDIDDAKLSKLKWVCAKIERQRKNMKEVASNQYVSYQKKICHKVAPSLLALAGPSVGQWNRSNSNEEMNAGAAGSSEVEIHQYDKCGKVFNSGQALGGHKRAHYTGPPLCRPGSNGLSQASTVATARSAKVEIHECEKCHKVFNSGQALGGHKRAHYTGPPLGRPASNARLQAGVAAAAAAVVRAFDLNEPVEEVSL